MAYQNILFLFNSNLLPFSQSSLSLPPLVSMLSTLNFYENNFSDSTLMGLYGTCIFMIGLVPLN